MAIDVCDVTSVVVMLKFGDLRAPAGTVTVAGGDATGFELASVTTAPPGGAGPVSVTKLPVVVPPPTTLVGDSVSDAIAGGFTVRVAVFVAPP
jgi:hypothetical protein